jgi:hypothetical protein
VTSTIARWLKEIISAAGIDPNISKAHSVRGATISVASNKGVTTEDILKAADWSTQSSFQIFYYKPVYNSSFGRSVLSTINNTIDM